MIKKLYRILVINWQDMTHPQAGGAEVHFHEIFKRIAAKGHQVTLLCCGYPGASAEEELDGIRILRRGNRTWFNFIVPGMYRQLRKQYTFDVVFDDINKIPFFTPLFIKEPLIAIVHHLFGKIIFKEVSLLPASYVYYAEKLIPRIYGKTPLMVVSPSSRNELIAKGISGENIAIIYNGVDCQQYRSDWSTKSSTPLIGYLGRMKRYKSVEHVIQAFALVVKEIPESRLLVVGNGDYLLKLKKLAYDLQLIDKITFTGHVSEIEKIHFLNQMWVCVNPSPKEGWGVSVIEANACGTPVIAANSPGLRDSVVDGETGMLYDYGNIDQLAATLQKIIAQDASRLKMSESAITWAQRYDWENPAQQTIRLIERTVEKSLTA